MSWNGLSFTAAAEAAGPRRSGAAIGFQQTVLGVGGIVIPIAFAAVVAGASWRVAFFAAAATAAVGAARYGRSSTCSERAKTLNVGVADRQLVELGVDAAELVGRDLVARVDLVVHIGSGCRIAFTAPKPLRVRSAAASRSTSISTSKTFCMQPT